MTMLALAGQSYCNAPSVSMRYCVKSFPLGQRSLQRPVRAKHGSASGATSRPRPNGTATHTRHQFKPAASTSDQTSSGLLISAPAAIVASGALASAVQLSSLITTQPPSVDPTVAALATMTYTTALLFLGYSSSFLVKHPSSKLLTVAKAFNSVRKTWMLWLQRAHTVFAMLGLWTLYRHPAIGESYALPTFFVMSVCIFIMASVELSRKQISKAVALNLDQLGPGEAHATMVQGALYAANIYTLLFFTCLFGYRVVTALAAGNAPGVADVCMVVLSAAVSGANLSFDPMMAEPRH